MMCRSLLKDGDLFDIVTLIPGSVEIERVNYCVSITLELSPRNRIHPSKVLSPLAASCSAPPNPSSSIKRSDEQDVEYEEKSRPIS